MKLSKICMNERYDKLIYRDVFETQDGMMRPQWVGVYVNKKFDPTCKANIKRCIVNLWKRIQWDGAGCE